MKTKIVTKWIASIIGIILIIWGLFSFVMTTLVNYSKYGTIFVNYSSFIIPVIILVAGILILLLGRKFFSNSN